MAFHVHTVAPYQSPPLVPFLGNIPVLCALWEDGSPALLLPTGTGAVPLPCAQALLCVFGESLRGALFSSLIVRGRLVRSTLAVGIWSFPVFGGGRLLLGLERERGEG